MNLVPGLLRGPAGRRALVAAAVIALLAVSLSAAETSLDQVARRPPGRAWQEPAPAAAGPGSGRALAAGIRLLHQAVRSARRISYRGVQVIAWRAPGGRRRDRGQPAAAARDPGRPRPVRPGHQAGPGQAE